MTLKEKVLNLLKTGWYSNFQINMVLKSSSADREMRRLRENPPEGRVVMQNQEKRMQDLIRSNQWNQRTLL